VIELAAVAYGEASVDDNPDEVLGIAFTAANRARIAKNSPKNVG
jgi:hypothetical protein